MIGFSFGMALAFCLSQNAAATLADACAKQTSTEAGNCEKDKKDPSKDEVEGCKDACDEAKKACEQAKSTCQSAAGSDQSLQKSGADSNQAAADSTSGPQSGTEGGNKSNMCSGQKTQQARQDAGKPVPDAMQKCIDAAEKCESKKGKAPAKKSAEAAKAAATKENADRAAEGGEMGKKCGKSDGNEQKMGQIPQMPPPSSQSPSDNKTPDSSPSTIASDPASSTIADAGTTAQVDSMNFGDAVKDAGVSMLPPSDGSLVSGAMPAGPTSFGASSGASTGSGIAGNAADVTGRNSAASGASSAPSGGAGGGGINSGGAAKPNVGIAAMDVKPQSNAFELSSGGGKSILGLKGKGGDDEELAAFIGTSSKDGGKSGTADSSHGRSLAGDIASKASASAPGEDNASLFKMVRVRYVKLRELGQI